MKEAKKIQARFVKGIVGDDGIVSDGIPQFAFVGRSNVGKSSIINSLTRANDMARVGKKPGKTTEINFFLVNNSYYLVDLPGYGFAKASLASREKLRARIIWYLTASGSKPTRIVLVVDSKVGLTDFDREMFSILVAEHHSFVIALSKIDRLSQKEASASIKETESFAHGVPVIPCSAQSGRGMKQLADVVFELK